MGEEVVVDQTNEVLVINWSIEPKLIK